MEIIDAVDVAQDTLKSSAEKKAVYQAEYKVVHDQINIDPSHSLIPGQTIKYC